MDPQAYIGRREVQADIADPQRIAGLAALLDHATSPWRPDRLPPLSHWLLFPPRERQSRLGFDGHAQRDESSLLPAIALPRRMWAGSRVEFLAEVALGTPLTRTSTVTSVTPKTGRTGEMLFVTILHEIVDAGGQPVIREEQDIVYREAPPPSPDIPALSRGEPQGMSGKVHRLITDPVLLFRYSALTFNGHRIHYDLDFCRRCEGYPGLVVHGPLTATLLVDHALRHRPQTPVRRFSFRGLAPLFCGEAVALDLIETGANVDLQAFGPNSVTMAAQLEYQA